MVHSLGFSVYRIMLPANTDSFASLFPIWMPLFLSNYCARISRTVLNSSGKSRHSCLIHEVTGKVCSLFFVWSIMLAVF